MTVGDLIEELKKYPNQLNICIWVDAVVTTDICLKEQEDKNLLIITYK